MPIGQLFFLTFLLVLSCCGFVWMLLKSRPSKPDSVPRKTDKEQIVDMLAHVKDQFALSIYKQSYDIADHEIAMNETPGEK
ncbi:MAG: hypothetical protein WAK95_09945 [Desulfobacterales bacterium]